MVLIENKSLSVHFVTVLSEKVLNYVGLIIILLLITNKNNIEAFCDVTKC